MNITKENLESAVQALNIISEGLTRLIFGTSHLKQSVEDVLKTEPSEPAPSLTEKFKTEFEASRPQTKPIQLKPPLPSVES